jgi:hypothetical protein
VGFCVAYRLQLGCIQVARGLSTSTLSLEEVRPNVTVYWLLRSYSDIPGSSLGQDISFTIVNVLDFLNFIPT